MTPGTHLQYSFFFQAEDGIRDHAQSRGLGDVYKRQPMEVVPPVGMLVCTAAYTLAADGAVLDTPINKKN